MLTAEQAAPDPLPATGPTVGTDPGRTGFPADSHGEFTPSPRHGRKAAAKPETVHQALPRCKHAGKHRRKALATDVRALPRTARHRHP
ncbi:hypothetical protein ACFU6I_47890 [Streptomyces sp. NPDC057486]|uniref:hypothetical protein n=1 Tax=Streptomyces sp. NPDC057486 TaxID=3346145 RepID=UPI003684565C